MADIGKRWGVEIEYADGAVDQMQVNEIEDLQKIVERGVPFEQLAEIRIKYRWSDG